VDATYRSKLREQNELNFARFDAKLEQRLAELKAELITSMFLFWAGHRIGRPAHPVRSISRAHFIR
jgi:hypothetical protein